jgi:hypothetical protein
MAKQKGGNRGILITVVVLVVITGIVVGVLFATGVLGKKSSQSSSTRLGPNVPNPGAGTPVTVNLSNPSINQGPSGPSTGISFNIQLTPEPLSLGNTGEFHQTGTLTFSDGSTETVNVSNPVRESSETGFSWQGVINGMGMNKIPSKIDLSGYYSYTNKSGINVDGPVSNTISMNVPTKY